MRIALPAGLLRRELRRIAPDVEGTQGRVRVTRLKRNKDHAEKHHSPSCEEEITRKEFDLSRKDKPVKPPTSKTQQDMHMKSVF